MLSGLSQIHVEVAVERLKRRFGVDVELHQPRVPYLETIRKEARARGRYKKQTGGRGQYGDCQIIVEPLEEREGYEFIDKIVGGVIPQSFRPAVDKGIQEAMRHGELAGAPVQGVRVSLVDGSYHNVDSSEMAFKIAGSMAFKSAYEQADPVLLEPIMEVDVTVPDEAVGAVNGDLNSRRGRLHGMEPRGGMTTIKAEVPMAEILTYSQSLTSLTGGRGDYAMHFVRYEEVRRTSRRRSSPRRRRSSRRPRRKRPSRRGPGRSRARDARLCVRPFEVDDPRPAGRGDDRGGDLARRSRRHDPRRPRHVPRRYVVPRDKHDITIRGVNRNAVVLDGENTRRTGIVVHADGVSILNLSAHDFAVDGFRWEDARRFRASYLTVWNVGQYGIYVEGGEHGTVDHDYVSGAGDAAYYVGECAHCDATVAHVVAALSAVGYSGTNASEVVIRDSVWDRNGAGILPNTYANEAHAPQRRATIVRNTVTSSGRARVPINTPLAGFIGIGIAVAGGNDTPSATTASARASGTGSRSFRRRGGSRSPLPSRTTRDRRGGRRGTSSRATRSRAAASRISRSRTASARATASARTRSARACRRVWTAAARGPATSASRVQSPPARGGCSTRPCAAGGRRSTTRCPGRPCSRTCRESVWDAA